VARVLALLVVVLGHLLLAVIDRQAGDLRGANLLALRPRWEWLAALAPMPVFFAAGGWANSRSTPSTAALRLRRLVGLGAVVVSGWSVAVVLTVLVAGDAGIVGDGARIATQPLWFVAVYVPLTSGGARLARIGATHAVPVIGGSLVLLAGLDAARFGLGAPGWMGWPGFFLAWGIPWIAGAWWRARSESGAFEERRAGLLLALGGVSGCVALVALAGYSPALIDAVPGARSNTTPPTLYTAVAGLAQVGALLVGARALDGVGRRWRGLWDRAGEVAVGVYVWHLTALALCAGAVAAGVPVPDRLTVLWWLTRPVWWIAVLAVTTGFVRLTAGFGSRRSGQDRAPVASPGGQLGVAIVVASAGGAVVGLRGPRTIVLAVVCSALFVAGWHLLRPPTG
jgi:hypothetical protein